MRMNRNLAQFRDIDRHRSSRSGSPQLQDEACLHFWKELVANWENRTEIVNYCVDVVEATMETKRQALAGQDPKLDENRRTASSLYTDEVKRNQMRNELTVEAIIRQRSLDGVDSSSPRSLTHAPGTGGILRTPAASITCQCFLAYSPRQNITTHL
ncbi:caffeine-induced death protein [Rhizoctonia solani]|uniref:Caffeine-induced death protein n=1 Tax=Rhizoctonia solani TaxID=456999 RepID=A0A8H8PAU8_9AGAM|nr:caffeine-induced death protein [Rhizoctonia solani]QRW26903.1 caffeine-induced death protein [Rhizoctonia solani]